MTKNCGTCAFWQQLSDDENAGYVADRNYVVMGEGEGICRRNPPAGQRPDAPTTRPIHSSDAAFWAQWPVTSGDLDWCGEHVEGRTEPPS